MAEGSPIEPIELDDVLEEVLVDLEQKIDASGAEISSMPLPAVRGERGQLRQVLLNLVDNAIKYAGQTPARIDIVAVPAGEMWKISVRDEGIGIDQESAESVFDVFSRLHSEERYPGTGIGLALCDRIIERHGGEITVESTPGEGATFVFTLPAAPRSGQ